MKKLLVVVLAVAMVLSQSVCALAVPVDETALPLTEKGAVEVTVDDRSTHDTKYCVTVEWTDTSMTYLLDGKKEWMVDDELGHYYDRSDLIGTWDDKDAYVAVTNHSNVSVNVDVAEDSDYTNTLTYTIIPGIFTLDAAEESDAYNEAPTETATITATSEPPSTESITDHFVVTITAQEQAAPTEPIVLDIVNNDEFTVKKGAEYEFNVAVMSLSAAQDSSQENPVSMDDYNWDQMTGIFEINDSYNKDNMYLFIKDDGMDRYTIKMNINN